MIVFSYEWASENPKDKVTVDGDRPTEVMVSPSTAFLRRYCIFIPALHTYGCLPIHC